MNELEEEQTTGEAHEHHDDTCKDCAGECKGGCDKEDCCAKDSDEEIPEGCCGGGCCM